jgi:trimethylamine--corrinoid protein Co-methyltransferase
MYSHTPDIIPFASPFKGELLSEHQLETLKAGTLHLLEAVGVHFPSQKALEIFADHGARVDWNSQIVQIPPDLVQKAMANAPRSFVLGGREERFDLLLDGTRSYLCTEGTGVHVIDPDTHQRRPSCKEDIAIYARVCDALPLISFYWPPVSAQDFGPTAPLHQCHAGLTNTLKHVRGGMTLHPRLVPYAVEMVTVVAGSVEQRRRHPPVCCNICTIAPLAQDEHGLETALIYAEAGIPVSFMAMPTMGSTAPATPLGALVQGDAEAVSGMVLLQLAHPGAPVFHSNLISLMHPQTGGYIGEVPLPLSLLAVEMAHAWQVPSLGGGSVSTDAAEIGWQVGCDVGFGAATIPLYAGEVCAYLGLTGGAMILSPEKLILDYEVCQYAYDVLHGFEFREADMALDVITRVGPRGHFLAQKHTRKHIRDFRLPPWRLRLDPEGNQRDPRDVAREVFKEIAATHQPQPLPQQVLAELDRILDAAEREAEGIST